MSFLLPRQYEFFDLFEDLGSAQCNLAVLLKEYATVFGNHAEYAKRAKEIEHRADETTHAIIERLNKTFITPFDREDIFMLAHALDDIVDLLENAVHNISVYGIEQQRPAFDEFARTIVEAAGVLEKLLELLRDRQQSPQLQNLKIRMHELEDQGDAIFTQALGELLRDGEEPLLVIKWKDILEDLEQTLDTYQRVADTIDGIIVKSS